MLVEVGRKVAPVPLAVHGACVAFLGGAGRPTDASVYAAAVAEERDHLPDAPTVVADAQGALTGTKTLVRAGMVADALLVTATGPDGSASTWSTPPLRVSTGRRSAPATAIRPH